MKLDGMTTDDRLKHHAKRIQAIGFADGANGVKRYKARYPEAASILHDLRSIAYRAKPKGYGNYVTSMVEVWLESKLAVFETNRADVERMNAHFETRRFNPNNHFSRLIPIRLRERLKTAFAAKGVPLDVRTIDTLSKVKSCAKAAKGYESASRRFGGLGVISGNVLIVGNRTFAIEPHNGHNCLRLRIKSKRVRLRLDALEHLVEGLVEMQQGKDPLSITLSSIGERAPTGDTARLEGVESSKDGEVAPKPWASAALEERLAALRSKTVTHSPVAPDDVDPLTL